MAASSVDVGAQPGGHKRPAYRARMALKSIGLAANLARRRLLGPAMRPSLFIVGAQKAGTTTLFGALARHPDVMAPLVKEVHYFDVASHRSEKWYGAHFPTQGEALRQEQTRGIAPMTFDTTPYYMFHPDVAARVKSYAPAAKIIAVLRDPVDRAWSHYWHEWGRSFERLGPVAAFEAEANRLAAPHEHVGPSAQDRFAHQHYSYLARSEYDRQIPRWFDLFGRDQVMVIKSERLFTDGNAVLAEVAEFLGLAPFASVKPKALNTGKYDAAPPEVAAWLENRLKGSMAATQALLGDEFRWR